jgi:hypothetical protein
MKDNYCWQDVAVLVWQWKDQDYVTFAAVSLSEQHNSLSNRSSS